MPKQLDFSLKYREITAVLETEKAIVLATAGNHQVSARTVFYLFADNSIYFLTSTAYLKYKQILKNPAVALCLGKIQIKGVAAVLGHPSLPCHKAVLDCFLQRCPDGSRYAKYKNAALVRVAICQIEMWNTGGREYIDFQEKTAYRIG